MRQRTSPRGRPTAPDRPPGPPGPISSELPLPLGPATQIAQRPGALREVQHRRRACRLFPAPDQDVQPGGQPAQLGANRGTAKPGAADRRPAAIASPATSQTTDGGAPGRSMKGQGAADEAARRGSDQGWPA
ncbi:MAG: hypothetical protein U5J62_03440 [Desulfurivibrio sp.]|nr:hypothetical protein [Desulfurivibrio sp.]